MTTRGRIVGAVVGALCAAAVAGCGGDDEVATGSLVQSWTIAGTQDQNQCVTHGAERMRVIVYDENGALQSTQFADCSQFQLSATLPVGTYRGSATFLTTGGAAVSDTLPIEAFTIVEGQTLRQVLDFPETAMLLP